MTGFECEVSYEKCFAQAPTPVKIGTTCCPFWRDGAVMIDTVLNLIFRCPHRHLTRPITPVHKVGTPPGETYVVCLDCTKQFAYDVENMQIGKPIGQAHDSYVLPRDSKPRHTVLKVALGVATVPLAVLAGSVLSVRHRNSEKKKNSDRNGNSRPAR